MAKKREVFSPEFKKVMEAIDNWRAVNNGERSFIASFVILDDRGDAVKDTMLLGFGYKDVCKSHLKVFERALNNIKDNFIIW